MVAGRLEPGQVRKLMKRLRAGHAEGLERNIAKGQVTTHASEAFARFPVRPRTSHFEVVSVWGAKAARQAAEVRVKNGEIVTLIVLSRTAM